MSADKQAAPPEAKRSFLRRRPILSFCLPFLGIFVVFLIAGSFTVAVEATNSTEFCTSCHTMRHNYEEYKQTIHYSNRSGVRAECSDCHVPKKNWLHKMESKVFAAKDVWAEITGVIDTKEKFEARRSVMANAVWAKMKASDSEGCRNCHSYESMDIAAQDNLAGKRHTQASLKETGKTCIECHKGIAHKLPKLEDVQENP